MKNVALLQSTKTESPKTPGGISKSLLTPCRRVGLSRNWKKSGPSPFVSPVPGSTQSNFEQKVEKNHTRKRKEPVPNDENEDLHEEKPSITIEGEGALYADESDTAMTLQIPQNIANTPTRHVALPRKKKSRLLADSNDKKSNMSPIREVQCSEEKPEKINDCAEYRKDPVNPVIDTLLNTHQTSSSTPNQHTPTKSNTEDIQENVDILQSNNKEGSPNKKSPNNLTKKCVVVIQKKIFKTKEKDLQPVQKKELHLGNLDCSNKTIITKDVKTASTFDSDSDDDPLCNLNKKESKNLRPNLEPPKQPEIIDLIEDDDFTGTNIVKVAKLVDKNTSTGGLRSGKIKKQKLSKPVQKIMKTAMDSKTSSQNSFEDDDDFEFETKKTILIRKTYDKVSKPVKAKTTGSITQKDIDELKARIEIKKKVLLAKATSEETRELRDLIKKWQKGCQDALAELMDLMKTKCPEKKHMDYSEMLQMLKIPSNLVGYNAEDDCFNTPDDDSIVLSNFNDI